MVQSAAWPGILWFIHFTDLFFYFYPILSIFILHLLFLSYPFLFFLFYLTLFYSYKAKDGPTHLFKAKDGLFRPCMVTKQVGNTALVTFTRCGRHKRVPLHSICPFTAALLDKPHTFHQQQVLVSISYPLLHPIQHLYKIFSS